MSSLLLRRLATTLSVLLLVPPVATAETAASAPSGAASTRHPLSIDDMMHLEGLGAAAVGPSGRWLVYERLRPYDQSDDYSFRTYAFAKTGHQLWLYDLRDGGAPRLLPGLDPTPYSYIQEFSASGRYLAVMQYRLGDLTLGAYDMAEHRFVHFPQTPAFSRDGAHNPVWASDREMIFAALPEGQRSELTSVRAETGRVLSQAWRDAWRGDVVTANEVRAPAADATDHIEAGRLMRADVQSGRTTVMAEGLYADLRVSPDHRFLAALAMSQPGPTDPNSLMLDDPRRYRLEVFDIASGDKRNLAPDLEVFPYTTTWSSDGRRLAVYAWRKGQNPREGWFVVIDVKSGAQTTYNHTGLDLVSERERGWLSRPERVAFLGDRLAVFARRIPDGQDQAPRFTPADFPATNNLRADWYALSADGTSTNLTTGLPNVSRVPPHAGFDTITVVADDGVYRLFKDGTRKKLSPDLPGVYRFGVSGTFTTHDSVFRPDFGDEAVFSVKDGVSAAQIVLVDMRQGHEGQFRVIDAPSADAVPLAGSLAANAVAFRAEEGAASVLFATKADAGAEPVKEIARINTALKDVSLGDWRTVSYAVEGADGNATTMTVESCVLMPPGFKAGDPPPPLIVEVYPATRPRCDGGGIKIPPYTVLWSPYLWAGRGYAYAKLSTPRGRLKTEAGPIDGMPALVDAGVSAIVAEGLADPNRLALVGYSQGGVSSLFTAAHLHRFKAITAMNSWADLFSHYFGSNGIYSTTYGKYFNNASAYDAPVGGDFSMGRTAFDDPMVYLNNSPVFLAPRITTPVMLIHSDMDSFPMYQFDEMYGALLRAGKDARYVRYWGEGHGPSSPANIRDMWARFDAFLAETGVAPTEAERRRTQTLP
ncbi:S9 family peptidase [Brevundimonas sp. SORGH_AS_0993]|uniref:alpha/beta hydrolase family protein n=1 Tax=Brevundimonas sp. SORGH_AS_0993 TaxID=3041794 RepID=UPI002787C654|nr:prolyl oligopeptidase family serine peptidase [Brevundimonas sp. SORGH_AS_0993]MDQ1153420.1 dipeptidyl aminopeptidase/acylaminoacyl peptidase [Brevundimonas sp. SORGH_AS_0993]